MFDVESLCSAFYPLQKETILLCPKKTDALSVSTGSKVGGVGAVDSLVPPCPECGKRIISFLQLSKVDFPTLYFPEGCDLLTIHRCTEPTCDGVFDDSMDMYTYMKYWNPEEYSESPAPENVTNDFLFPVCQLNPVAVADYPAYSEELAPELILPKHLDQEEINDLIEERYRPRRGTKVGGYPSFIQDAWYPTCKECKQNAEFIFQLAEGESIDAITENEYPHWSDHGLTIGDLGNIYAYVCKRCRPNDILTYWDCY